MRTAAFASAKASAKSVLGKCSTDYALSLADPFDGPEGACIPDYPALMTGRRRVWTKGTVTTSNNATSGGVGFIVLNPLGAIDNSQAWVSTNALNDFNPSIALGGISYPSNSEYSGVVGLQWRIVSCGLRIRYIGSEFQRGGSVTGLHDPAHQTTLGLNQSGMLAFKEAKEYPNTSKTWTTLLYRPVDTTDLDYQTAIPTFANPGGGYMAFFMTSFDTSGATPQQYMFEAVCNLEVQGKIVSDKRPSHVDPTGHGAVNAISNMATAMHSPHQSSGFELGKAVVGAATGYVKSYLTDPHADSTGNSRAIVPYAGKAATSTEPSVWKQLLGLAPDIIELGMEIMPMLL